MTVLSKNNSSLHSQTRYGRFFFLIRLLRGVFRGLNILDSTIMGDRKNYWNEFPSDHLTHHADTLGILSPADTATALLMDAQKAMMRINSTLP
jgi:hypothetical protein